MEYELMGYLDPPKFLKQYKVIQYNKSHKDKAHVILSHFAFHCEQCGANLVWPCLALFGDEAEKIGYPDSTREETCYNYTWKMVHRMTECPKCGKEFPEEYLKSLVRNDDDKLLRDDIGIMGEFYSTYDDEKNKRIYGSCADDEEEDVYSSEETTYDISNGYDEEEYSKRVFNSFKILRNVRCKYLKEHSVLDWEEEARAFIDKKGIIAEKNNDSLPLDKDDIKKSPEKLLEYVKEAFELEQNKQSLESRILSLWVRSKIALLDKDNIIEENSIDANEGKNSKEKKIKSEYNKEKKKIEASDFGLALLEIPKKPVDRSFMPQEPEYKKPGLFNKKAVTIANDELKAAYELQMKEYLLEKDIYDAAVDTYKIKHKEVMAENKRIKKEIERRRQEALEKAKEKMDKKLNALEDNNGSIDFTNVPEVQVYELINGELEYAKKCYLDFLDARMSFYNVGVIFEKYRSLPALATIYEYLASGRCSSLEGSEGAYNLYESEIRANTIITKLDVVIDKLDDIRESQYSLCSALANIQLDLENIDNKLTTACNSLKSIDSSTSKMKKNTKDIAKNTAVSAYYDERTAYYAKITSGIAFANLLSR